MTTKNYLIVESGVVTNTVAWDGNLKTWTPPADSIQLIRDNTPAMVWVSPYGVTPPEYTLTEVIGVGDIGFIWDSINQVLTTNKPMPILPVAAPNQPATIGTQTL